MFHIFDTLIMPILTYGSDVWGHNKNAHTLLDKVFLRFIRCTMYAGSQMHHEQCYCLWWVWAYAPEYQVYYQFFVLYEQTYAHEWRFASKKRCIRNWKTWPMRVLAPGSVHCIKWLMPCSLTCTCILLNFVNNVNVLYDQNLSKNGHQI